MLDKLIESKKDNERTKRLGGFMSATATGAVFVLTAGFIYSIFAADIALASGDDLTLSALVAPVSIAEDKPQPERATAAPKQQATLKTSDVVPTRRENMMRVDEQPTKAPDTVSINRNTAQARPDGQFKLSNVDSNIPASGAYTSERGTGTGDGTGVGSSNSTKFSNDDASKIAALDAPPPPPLLVKPAAKEPAPEKKVTTVSGGVVNGKAATLVQPVYSAAARAIRAQGEVRVAVTIDEDGRVVAANALNGNPLLAPSAVAAARASKFTPTFLSNQRVKVTGVIVYNFRI